jgi:carboxypeptidase Taq
MLATLRALLAEARDLDRAAQVLEWDQQTYMPAAGAPARAEQVATLRRLAHERYTAPEVGRLLAELGRDGALGDYDSDAASLVRVNRREHDRKRRVPAELVAEIARAGSLALAAWEEARAASDYGRFRPHLERMVQLKRRWAECFGPGEPYDALLQDYEPGMTAAQVRAILAELKAGLVPLVQATAGRAEAVDDACLQHECDDQKQWNLALEAIQCVGFDLAAGRQDRSAHPFTTHFSHRDVRLTTRVLPDRLASALYSSLHEAGHGLYEQGVGPALARTWLDQGASLGMHESQSRLWENHVGRSRAFWRFFFPRVQAAFPDQMAGQSAESLFRAVNKVEPSLIRTEADEVTYDLHIMLRVELEQEMLAGRVAFADLPAIWNERMRAYLGVTPPNDAAGVLQDIHWADGYLGYFATYTLGNILAAQFFAQARRELPELEAQHGRGEFAPLLGWLREKIYRHGRKFTLNELVQRVTGGPLSTGPYLEYLRAKYGEIYGVEVK